MSGGGEEGLGEEEGLEFIDLLTFRLLLLLFVLVILRGSLPL